MRHLIAAVAVLGFAGGCEQKNENQGASADASYRSSGAESQTMTRDSTEPGSAANQPADNTGRNARDRFGDTLTASDQGASESDRELTRRIRRVITQNSQLSTTAQNIKIMTVNGRVTLRGPVRNEGEAKAIGDAAQSIAGPGSVENQLEIKTTN